MIPLSAFCSVSEEKRSLRGIFISRIPRSERCITSADVAVLVMEATRKNVSVSGLRKGSSDEVRSNADWLPEERYVADPRTWCFRIR